MEDGEHDEVRDRLESYAAGLLDGVEWLAVRTHLAECDPCRAELVRPKPWNRAAPQRIAPRQEPRQPRTPLVWRLFLVTAVVGVTLSCWVGNLQ